MKLTAQHLKYCQLRALGDTRKQDCYMACFPDAKKESAAVLANRLERKDEIKAEIKRLQLKTETPLVLSRQEKREFLASVVRDPQERVGNKTKCIEIDNKMAGHNEPDEVNVTHDGGVMHVPMLPVPEGSALLTEWEKQSVAQQASLKGAGK